jgi:intracellular septation protein A
MNSFVGIIVIIMIMYAGATLLFGGDEEKFKKAKNTILYIVIGIAILVLNYFILTFFIKPEVAI